MKVRKVIRKGIDSKKDGIRVAGGVNAVVAANVHEPGSQGVRVSSRQRIVQSSRGTQIHEDRIDTSENEGGKDG